MFCGIVEVTFRYLGLDTTWAYRWVVTFTFRTLRVGYPLNMSPVATRAGLVVEVAVGRGEESLTPPGNKSLPFDATDSGFIDRLLT
jgi:hypothetical protein